MGKAKRNREKRAAEHYGPYERPRPKLARVAEGAVQPFDALGDARSRDPVLGRCYLCGEEAVLEHGHILPRWATKDWAGTTGAIAMKWDLSAASHVRDGQRFYILCGKCERYIGEGEGLLKRVQRDSGQVLKRNGLALVRGPEGLLRVTGPKLSVLHRGLLAIAFKLAITDPLPGRRLSRERLAGARAALQRDDYTELGEPIGILMTSPADTETWQEAHVVAGMSSVGARFTIGKFHWFVPLGPSLDGDHDIGWTLYEYEVDPADPTNYLWIEEGDLDPQAMLATLARKRQDPRFADPRGL